MRSLGRPHLQEDVTFLPRQLVGPGSPILPVPHGCMGSRWAAVPAQELGVGRQVSPEFRGHLAPTSHPTGDPPIS